MEKKLNNKSKKINNKSKKISNCDTFKKNPNNAPEDCVCSPPNHKTIINYGTKNEGWGCRTLNSNDKLTLSQKYRMVLKSKIYEYLNLNDKILIKSLTVVALARFLYRLDFFPNFLLSAISIDKCPKLSHSSITDIPLLRFIFETLIFKAFAINFLKSSKFII